MEDGNWSYQHSSGHTYRIAFRSPVAFVAYRALNGTVRVHVRPAAADGSLPPNMPAPFAAKQDDAGPYASAAVEKSDARVVLHRAVDWIAAAAGCEFITPPGA